VLLEPVLLGPVLLEPVLLGPVLLEPVLPGPALRPAPRRKLIGIGRYRSITYRPGVASRGLNLPLPSPPGRSFSPPLRAASHDE
jgi:hypothetical protein